MAVIDAEKVNRDVDTLRRRAAIAERNEDRTRERMRDLVAAVEDFLEASATPPHLAINARHRLVQAVEKAGGNPDICSARARRYAAMPSEDR